MKRSRKIWFSLLLVVTMLMTSVIGVSAEGDNQPESQKVDEVVQKSGDEQDVVASPVALPPSVDVTTEGEGQFLAGGALSFKVTITNTGTEEMNLADYTLVAEEANQLDCNLQVPSLSGSLAAGADITVTVTGTIPYATWGYEETILLSVKKGTEKIEGSEGYFSFKVKGNYQSAEAVSGTLKFLDNKPTAGSTVTATLELKNVGTETLDLSKYTLRYIEEHGYEYFLPMGTVKGLVGTVAPDNAVTVSIDYTIPQGSEGAYLSIPQIALFRNDPYEGGEIWFPVNMNVDGDWAIQVDGEVPDAQILPIELKPNFDTTKVEKEKEYSFKIKITNPTKQELKGIRVEAFTSGWEGIWDVAEFKAQDNVTTYPGQEKLMGAVIKSLAAGASIELQGTIKMDKTINEKELCFSADAWLPNDYGVNLFEGYDEEKLTFTSGGTTNVGGNDEDKVLTENNGAEVKADSVEENGTVKTGDVSPIMLLVVLMGVSAVVGTLVWRKRA